MEINEVKQIMEICLKEKENNDSREKYKTIMSEYIKANGVNNGICGVIINGIDIDRCTSFLDYIDDLDEYKLKEVWQNIRKCNPVSKKKTESLKFLFLMLYNAVIKVGRIDTIAGSIISSINSVINKSEKEISNDSYGPIFVEYFASEFDNNSKLPKWEDIKIQKDVLKKFTIAMKSVIENNDKVPIHVKHWIEIGEQYVENENKKKNSKKIFHSRIKDLSSLVEHYKKLEEEYQSLRQKNSDLQNKNEVLQEEINKLKMHRLEANKENQKLSKLLDERQNELNKAQKEIEDRKKVADVQKSNLNEEKNSMLEEIARALKVEYEDYFETIDIPMNMDLGEIYKDKLGKVLSILNQKGIKVEK